MSSAGVLFADRIGKIMLTLPKIQIARRADGRTLVDLVGNTPLLRLRRIAAHLPETVEVYAKAEWFNPSG